MSKTSYCPATVTLTAWLIPVPAVTTQEICTWACTILTFLHVCPLTVTLMKAGSLPKLVPVIVVLPPTVLVVVDDLSVGAIK